MAYEGAPEPLDKTEVLRYKIARDIHALSDGEAGDATAANQALQITAEQAILAALSKTAITTLQNNVTGTANGSSLALDGYHDSCWFRVIGLAGGGSVAFEYTNDGTNWFSFFPWNPTTFRNHSTAVADGLYRANCAGFSAIRARATGVTGLTVTAGAERLGLQPPASYYDTTTTQVSAAKTAGQTTVIPVGAKEWTATVWTGTATINGAAGCPAGFSDGSDKANAATITITFDTPGTGYVRYAT